MAANKSDLEEAAIELGISVLKIEPRVFRNSTIKIGGWTLWADIDSPTPDVLSFDGQEYAIIWKGKDRRGKRAKPIKPATNSVQSVETTNRTARPVKTIEDEERMAIVLSKKIKESPRRNKENRKDKSQNHNRKNTRKRPIEKRPSLRHSPLPKASLGWKRTMNRFY